MPEVMEDTVALVDRRQELADGCAYGLAAAERDDRGWQPGNLIFTAARPADGKTALDLFFARQAAMAGVPVVFFTLEMTASELGERMVLAESSADPLRIRQGRLAGGGGGCAPYGGTDERAAGACRRYAVHQRRPVVCHRQVAAGKGAAGLAYRRLSATACHGESGAYA